VSRAAPLPAPDAAGADAAGEAERASRYLSFSRADWAGLRAATPLTLSPADVAELRGLNEPMSMEEVADVYLPLSRLLNLRVAAQRSLDAATAAFLGTPARRLPYVLGLAGSVAVGKSTIARIIRALVAQWPDGPRVDLVATDGFLYPTQVLEARGLLERKGFPETYDVRRLIGFLAAVKSGLPEVTAPVYSHLRYDILADAVQVVRRPDVLIVEGLNVLQTGARPGAPLPRLFVSDFFDFTIYVDADEALIRRWYVERFLTLRDTVFRDPTSYFHRYAGLSESEAVATAERIWEEINGANLAQNIRPTRERAHLILQKGAHHAVERVLLRAV
jgi:type I pantothenate kinase